MITKRGALGSARTSRQGTALLYALILAVGMAGLCLAMLGMNLGTEHARDRSRDEQKAFYAAEAGLSEAKMRLTSGELEQPNGAPVYLGTEDAPLELGPSTFWAEVTNVDSRSYSIVSTGIDDGTRQRLELVVSQAANGFFQYAAFGRDGVNLDSNAFIDSYDSMLGTYDSQVKGGNDYAREHGDVGSNDDVVLHSNTEIHGDVIPGPNHVVDEQGPNITISGSTDPADLPVLFPPINVPVVPSSGTYTGKSELVLGPGEVHYDSILMNGGGTLKLVGPATVVIDDLDMKSNTDLVFETDGGPVELYGTGDFVLESNSRVTTHTSSAVDVKLFLSGNNIDAHPGNDVELGANSEFIGAIYAPNANFSLASNFDVYGSIMCGYLNLSSFGQIHFDEALLYDGDGSSREYTPELWHTLSPE